MTYSESDLELLEAKAVWEARRDFWAYRQYINPKLKRGWWQREVARELQEFHAKLCLGLRPALAIAAPPQHGKSIQVTDFLAWVQGQHICFPERCGVFADQVGLRQVYASFSDRLGARANMRIQQATTSPRHSRVFPAMRLPMANEPQSANRDIVEFPDTSEAYFRNTTVAGSITGEGLDLGVVDDPIRGRADASSPAVRAKAWNWFTDDLLTRFSEYAGFLMIATRWNVDDPRGRLEEMKERGELPLNLRLIDYKAIATEDEEFRKAGEPLFPELKSRGFLLSRKAIMLDSNWEALYQQAPYVADGEIFPLEKFQIVDYVPRDDIRASARYWDKAGTKDGAGAETAGTLMHRLKDGTYLIEHVEHGRWAYLERERKIKAWASVDGFGVQVYVEQEPGSGGKESAEATILNLAGSAVFADRPTGDKALRAEPYAAQVQAGHVKLLRAPWNKPFLDQHQQFPNGKLKDMVDSSSGAFNKVTNVAYDMEALSA